MSFQSASYSSEEARTVAIIELNETEGHLSSLQVIKEWLAENPKLNAKTDDHSIIAFLRGCKYNLDKTKRKIQNFYVMKAERPEWFTNRNPRLTQIHDLLKLGVFVPLRCFHENKLVVIIRTAVHNPKIHKQDDVFKAGKMVLDVAVKEYFENATIFGVSAIFDMKGVSLAHARQLPPSVIKKAVFAWQNYHCRPKQLEFVNAPLYVNVVLNVFRRFMSEKLKGRIRVHFSGLSSLHEVIPQNILPVEYGGTNGTMSELIEYWFTKLDQYSEWFEEDEKYKADLTR